MKPIYFDHYDGICVGCAEPILKGESVQTRPRGRKFHEACLARGGYYAKLEQLYAAQENMIFQAEQDELAENDADDDAENDDLDIENEMRFAVAKWAATPTYFGLD